MQQLMKQAQKMQAQMAQAQAELAEQQVIGSAAGDAVVATVTGSGELLSIVINPAVVDPQDVETLQDLIVVAIRDADRASKQLQADTMGPLTGGLGGLGLPGM